MSKKAVSAYKFTLSSGKVIVLREPRISDSRLAAQSCGRKAEGNQALLQIMMQEEVFRNVLLQIDGNDLSGAEKQNLDKLFNVQEYNQSLMCLQKITGDEEQGNLTPEMVTIGDQ